MFRERIVLLVIIFNTDSVTDFVLQCVVILACVIFFCQFSVIMLISCFPYCSK